MHDFETLSRMMRQHAGPRPAGSGPASAGLPSRGLHEFHAAAADAVSLSGLALGLAAQSGRRRPLLHVGRSLAEGETGPLHGMGLAEFGLDPARLLPVRLRDPVAVLQAALEGAACAALDAVIVELWGEVRAYDLTASRRLALAARNSGVPVFVLRVGAAAVASAAETRWQVRAVPSVALAANAPGRPAFDLTLLRARNGQEGLRYHVEWDRALSKLVSRLLTGIAPDRDLETGTSAAARRRAALPGAVVSLPVDRQGTPPSGPQRRAG